jgi:hypothetical protein
MALNKDILGANLYAALTDFNDKDPATLGDLETARLAFCKAMADEVIKHITTAGVVPALGLVAPGGAGGPVTGAAMIT